MLVGEGWLKKSWYQVEHSHQKQLINGEIGVYNTLNKQKKKGGEKNQAAKRYVFWTERLYSSPTFLC